MAPQRAFVTGATGQVGLNLVEVLCDAGWEVTAMTRPTSDTSELAGFPVRITTGDIVEGESVTAAMPDRVDVVFHVAASTSLWSKQRRAQEGHNILGTRNVVAAARARRAGRMIHTSSFVVHGFHDHPVDEDSERRGASSWIGYVRTKALAEQEVDAGIARGLDAVLVNPANVLGRYDRGNWSRVLSMVADDRLPGVPPGSASFCDARTVARAHLAAAESGRTGARYLLGGADASFLELVTTAGRVVGREVPSRATPAPLLRTIGRLSQWWSNLSGREPELTPEGVAIVCRRMHCRSDRAERELGYRSPPLEEMVRDCWQWMQRRGP